jgi:3-deoxy-D-manno-octulosonic-acid transferase
MKWPELKITSDSCLFYHGVHHFFLHLDNKIYVRKRIRPVQPQCMVTVKTKKKAKTFCFAHSTTSPFSTLHI